jgi:hypothetical protein
VKKYLPFIILGVGLLFVLIVGVLIFKSVKGKTQTNDDDTVVAEIPVDQRPFVSLTPTSDGHYLNFVVKDLKVKGAVSMDYLLVYSTSNGGQQGVPGTIQLNGDVDKKLLLGSESSGKFRYDTGVTGGTMTLRFRNSAGKLIGKLETAFTFSSPEKNKYVVSMDTFTQGTKEFSSN